MQEQQYEQQQGETHRGGALHTQATRSPYRAWVACSGIGVVPRGGPLACHFVQRLALEPRGRRHRLQDDALHGLLVGDALGVAPRLDHQPLTGVDLGHRDRVEALGHQLLP